MAFNWSLSLCLSQIEFGMCFVVSMVPQTKLRYPVYFQNNTSQTQHWETVYQTDTTLHTLCFVLWVNMMIADPFRPRPVPKLTWAAAVPFPRSTWIHPYVPEDDFDRVSYTIWKNAQRQGTGVLRTRTTKEVEVDSDQRSLATPCSERCTVGAEDQEGRWVTLPTDYLMVGLVHWGGGLFLWTA